MQALFEQILAGLLSRVADGNGRVQEAACSGLAELLEHAGACTHGAVLVPRLQVCWGAALPISAFHQHQDMLLLLSGGQAYLDTTVDLLLMFGCISCRVLHACRQHICNRMESLAHPCVG